MRISDWSSDVCSSDLADFDTAVGHDAGFAAAYSNRGLCHLDRYEDLKAVDDFTRALELGGEQVVTLFHRAAAFARLKRHAAAEADLTRAAAYASAAACIFHRPGIARAAHGKLDEALDAFDRTIAAHPTFAPPYGKRPPAHH